ncbi:c-type cytochrome [Nitratiruptor sp. SB155-2]|uniref:c-type cytochrome n=1 Tax=Nitratiruptor sp. (strain SB155-2) TaxID=387092 RepID=UPI00015872A7|nr:hypothetical protein [Nitratiruptor sp. SB155-2]BAF69826.1 conserved hypothetical protein [Nitratiruptor sp. SB155-2]
MRLFFVLLFSIYTFALDDSFITKDEYAKMLYKNPRGIGCDKCHGKKGEGRVIGKYRDGNVTKVIKGPEITNIDYHSFHKALTTQKHHLMPHYFLTDKEIKTLYYYLQKSKKKKK